MAGRMRAARARGWLVAVVVVLLALDLAAGATAALRGAGRAEHTPGPGVAATGRARPSVAERPGVDDVAARARSVRLAAVRRLLDARASAVLGRDRAAFLATVDHQQPGFLAVQAKVYDDLAGVPLASWTYELDPATEYDVSGPRFARYHAAVWAPAVTLHYALAGFDSQPTADTQYLTFVHRAAGWRIGSDSDFAAAGMHTARGLWDFAPVEVVRGQRSLVLGHPGSHALMQQLATEVDQAVPRVTAVWGSGWSQHVVVLVPDSQAELSQLVDSTSDLSQIAAVATAELTGAVGAREAVGDRIIVNPPNFALLGPLGRHVVVTHEVTHVASRSATGPDSPTWLVEGIADYIGYLDTGVSVSSAARELRDDVRAGKLPAALPADAAFDGGNGALPQVYEQSWLAVRLIVERTDRASLLRFYRAIGAAAAGDGDAVGQAFAAVLHTSVASFTAAWRTYLRAQLS